MTRALVWLVLAMPLTGLATRATQEPVDFTLLRRNLAAARLHWATRRPANYEFVLSIPNGDDWWTRRFPAFRITGETTTVLAAPAGKLAELFASHSTVDLLFDLIEQQIAKPPQPHSQIWLHFDEQLGYPVDAMFGDVSFRMATFRPFSNLRDVTEPFVLIEHVNHCGFGMPDPTDIKVCPTYSIAMWGDGTVAYDGGSGVTTIGRRAHRVEQSAVHNLVQSIVKSGFFQLHDSYASAQIVDHAAEQWITIRINGAQKTVHDFDDAPPALRELESAIEKASDSHRYTGRREE